MKHLLACALGLFLVAPTTARAQSQSELPPELATPSYRTSELTGIGYDPDVGRQDPSNVLRVGDVFYVWYTRYPYATSGWAGTVYWATSRDGKNWTEHGQALDRGPAGAWDDFGVITPYVAAIEGKYYLYYTGSAKKDQAKVRPKTRCLGVAVADNPRGPWRRQAEPVLTPGSGDAWDATLVDDAHVIVRDGKYWLYFKGYNWPSTWKHTRWGLAIADSPTGPFTKHKTNPVLGSGHTVCVWPHRKGVAALVDNAGPERFTVQWSPDGIQFQRAAKLEIVHTGCGPYDPDAHNNTAYGRGITWGVAQEPGRGRVYIVRFDVELEAPQPSQSGPTGTPPAPSAQANTPKDPSEATDKAHSRIEETRRLRANFQDDPHRPAYHFASWEGDCHAFDPNGAIFWKGRYHLFHIFQPGQRYGVNSSWAHASSADLLHWRLHPTALRPGQGDSRIYSGNALVNKDGIPTIVYNGVTGICIATSTDDELIRWTKSPKNPVIPRASDVHAWLEGDTYYAILSGRDTAQLYRSKNLINWENLHPFYRGDRKWTASGEDCSCPDFFALGNKHVLVCMSHPAGSQYYVGRYEGERFYPEQHGRMNWQGGTLVSPESFVDNKGRRILWNWACESRTGDAQKAAGWSGVLTLPRVLSLSEDGLLGIEPVEEIEQLRHNRHRRKDIPLTAEAELTLEDVRGDCLELAMEVEPGDAKLFGLKVFASPNGAEQTVITFDFAANTLTVDASASSLSEDIYHPWPNPWSAHHPPGRYAKQDFRVQKAPFELREGERLRLRIFLDRSILEIYANGRQCVTQRVYPTRADAKNVILFSSGGRAKVLSLDTWKMAPARFVDERKGLPDKDPNKDPNKDSNKDEVLFEDRFDGKLGEGWSWLRENPEAWRVKDGALEIRVEPGKPASVAISSKGADGKVPAESVGFVKVRME